MNKDVKKEEKTGDNTESNNIKNNKKKIYNIKTIFKQYIKFYNNNLKFKHIVITIIMLIIFFIMLNFSINKAHNLNIEGKNIINNKSILNIIIKEKVPLCAVIIFAGITPFAFLSVLGVIYSYILASNLCKMYIVSKAISTLILGSISAVLQIIGIGISIATGIYYCIQSSKKFRYSQYMGFGIKDIKGAYYQIRKDEKKLKQLQEKEYKKAQKRERLNVKIPYINFIVSFVITMIFLIIGTIIDYIII